MADKFGSLEGFWKTTDAYSWKARLEIAPKATQHMQNKNLPVAVRIAYLAADVGLCRQVYFASDTWCRRGGALPAFHLPAGRVGGQPLSPLRPGALDLGTQWPNLIATTDL